MVGRNVPVNIFNFCAMCPSGNGIFKQKNGVCGRNAYSQFRNTLFIGINVK